MDIFSNWIMIWLVLLVIFLVIEMLTMGLATIWCAAGAVAALICALLGLHPGVQIAVFAVISGVLLLFTRPIAVKFFNRNRVRTNVESMIGKQGIVLTEIDNLAGTGQVQVDGMEWMSRNYIDDGLIEPGEVVIVRAVSGVKLMVERSNYTRG